MSKFLDNTGVTWLFNKIKSVFLTTDDGEEVDTITVDASPTANSTGLVTSGGVYNAINPALESTQPLTGMLPNIPYSFGTLSADTTFTLDTTNVTSGSNHYYWIFDIGGTVPTITWPDGLTWYGGAAPVIQANKHYEISVLNGIAAYMET